MVKKKGRKRKSQRDSSPSDDDISAFTGRRGETAPNANPSLNSNVRRVNREKRELALVVADDEVDTSRPISWQSLNAGPSDRTPRRFCCVCSLEASMHCPTCYKNKPTSYIRFICSAKCLRVHVDIDCCKPRQWLTW